MGINFTSYIREGYGNSVTDMEDALKYQEINRRATAYFHPEGANFVLSIHGGTMNVFRVFLIPEGKEPIDFGFSEYPSVRSGWPVVTGRDMITQESDFMDSAGARNAYFDCMEKLIEDGWDKAWMMIGPGMEQLTPHILSIKNKRGSSAPVVISEPIDYGLLGSSLSEMNMIINEMGYGDMNLMGLHPSGHVNTALERIEIMRDNPNLVHGKFMLGKQEIPSEIMKYSGSVYAAVDFQAAGLYGSPDGDNEKISNILSGFMDPAHMDNLFVI